MLTTLAADARFAGRMLRKSPIFTAVAVLVIALGTGAVTTIYSAMSSLLLRPLPGVADGSRLVGLEMTRRDGGSRLIGSYALLEHLRERSRHLEDVAAWQRVPLSIAAGGVGSAAEGNIVSGNYFDVLGVRPALGRFFAPDEIRTPMTHPVVVLSHSFWTARLGGDPDVLGRSVTVNGHPYTVIGIAPAEFRGVFTVFLPADAWVPLTMQQLRPRRDMAETPWLRMFGRLRDGVDAGPAAAELSVLAAERAADVATPPDGRAWQGLRVHALRGLPEDARGPFLGFLALLMGAAALVLLIAGVNVASMLSARAIARRREMSLRTALGATRGRLVAQMLTETLLLFVMGAAGGVLLALLATAAVARVPVPIDAPLAMRITPDARVLLFSLGLALATGIAFGLAPALRASRSGLAVRLRDDTAGGGTRRTLAGNAMIVGQLALSLVLLVGAGLFLRALGRGQSIDPGFERAGVVTTSLDTEAWGYDADRGREFLRALRERVAGLPGVTDVSYGGAVPLAAMTTSGEIFIEGRMRAAAPDAEPAGAVVQYMNVGPDYFSVVQLPLAAGRTFRETDDERAPRVAIVNETLARRFWPDGGALGSTFTFRGERVTIVGVARDAKYGTLGETTPAFVYVPIAQLWQQRQFLLARTAGDPRSLAALIQRAVRELDESLPPPAVVTLEEATSVVLLPQRIAAIVTGVLGGVGLVLAAVGLYGIIAFSTSRRTREIGIRMALGARRADVLGMVVREGLGLAMMGVVLGVLLAALATRLLSGFLFGVSPLDAATFAGMAALFFAVAAAASWLPARRAAAADPMTALRVD